MLAGPVYDTGDSGGAGSLVSCKMSLAEGAERASTRTMTHDTRTWPASRWHTCTGYDPRAHTGSGIFAILFRPARNLPSIAQVTFEGNQVIPQGVLRREVHLTAVGAPFTESSFRDLLNNAVRPLYEQRGRVRMKVLEVRAQPVSDVETGAKRALRFFGLLSQKCN
jgi:Surface antigen variable number repeat